MAASLCVPDAGPASLRRSALTCFVVLLLLPLPSKNLGYKEDYTQPVCGKPWWTDSLEKMHHWPWEVSLRIENNHVCGGALIDLSWVVSAAHCIKGNKEYSVVLGTSKIQPNKSSWALKIPVHDIIVHPKFWGWKFMRNDLALLRLETPVTFNKYVQPICLSEHDITLKTGTQCWVTGWGQAEQHSSELREAQVFILDNKQCDRTFRQKPSYPRSVPLIRKTMICATNYGENLCYEDPGGPLACEVNDRWILAGVLSWKKDCDKPQQPGVYTRLTEYRKWINEQMSSRALPGPRKSSWFLLLSWLLRLPVGP